MGRLNELNFPLTGAQCAELDMLGVAGIIAEFRAQCLAGIFDILSVCLRHNRHGAHKTKMQLNDHTVSIVA